jgi:predicted ester cyclase
MEQALDQAEENRQLIREHHDKYNRGDWKAATEDYATDTLNFGQPGGRALVFQIVEDLWRMFPEAKVEILDIVAEGDSVAVRCRFSGTHRGVGQMPVHGAMLLGVEPTGKSFDIAHMHWYKLRDGKIVDHYGTRDDLGMMVQLGVVSKD